MELLSGWRSVGESKFGFDWISYVGRSGMMMDVVVGGAIVVGGLDAILNKTT